MSTDALLLQLLQLADPSIQEISDTLREAVGPRSPQFETLETLGDTICRAALASWLYSRGETDRLGPGLNELQSNATMTALWKASPWSQVAFTRCSDTLEAVIGALEISYGYPVARQVLLSIYDPPTVAEPLAPAPVEAPLPAPVEVPLPAPGAQTGLEARGWTLDGDLPPLVYGQLTIGGLDSTLAVAGKALYKAALTRVGYERVDCSRGPLALHQYRETHHRQVADQLLRRWGVDEALMMDRNQERQGLRSNDKRLRRHLEALIGALAAVSGDAEVFELLREEIALLI